MLKVHRFVIVICLLANIAKADYKNCVRSGYMAPCVTDVLKGDATKECCVWSTPADWGIRSTVKGETADIVWKAGSPEKAGKGKCAALGRPFKRVFKISDREYRFECKKKAKCHFRSNTACANVRYNERGRSCLIENDDYPDTFDAKKCIDISYKAPVYAADGTKVVDSDGKQKMEAVHGLKPVGGGDTETVCPQNSYNPTAGSGSGKGDFYAGDHRIKVCVVTMQKKVESSMSPPTLGHWLDYNKRYDNGGNEYLFSLEIAILWMVSMCVIGGTCFCIGAVAFYAAQRMYGWISKDIKN